MSHDRRALWEAAELEVLQADLAVKRARLRGADVAELDARLLALLTTLAADARDLAGEATAAGVATDDARRGLATAGAGAL